MEEYNQMEENAGQRGNFLYASQSIGGNYGRANHEHHPLPISSTSFHLHHHQPSSGEGHCFRRLRWSRPKPRRPLQALLIITTSRSFITILVLWPETIISSSSIIRRSSIKLMIMISCRKIMIAPRKSKPSNPRSSLTLSIPTSWKLTWIAKRYS